MKREAKIKTYVLTVSRVFPSTHRRKGEQTDFPVKILNNYTLKETIHGCKLHTIRANYDLWKKRIDEVNEGKARLSVRIWSAKPYNSKQEEIVAFDKDSGIGIQPLEFDFGRILEPFVNLEYSQNGTQTYLSTHELANHDGFRYSDFIEWFKKYNLEDTLAIIHFTKFRY